jgi:hypothetical protein
MPLYTLFSVAKGAWASFSVNSVWFDLQDVRQSSKAKLYS